MGTRLLLPRLLLGRRRAVRARTVRGDRRSACAHASVRKTATSHSHVAYCKCVSQIALHCGANCLVSNIGTRKKKLLFTRATTTGYGSGTRALAHTIRMSPAGDRATRRARRRVSHHGAHHGAPNWSGAEPHAHNQPCYIDATSSLHPPRRLLSAQRRHDGVCDPLAELSVR